MSVGNHYSRGDWNAALYDLFRKYKDFCIASKKLADAVAPRDNSFFTTIGFVVADAVNADPNANPPVLASPAIDEVSDLKGGINVADALRKLSEGDTSAPVVAMAAQVAALVGKFGDF